MLPLVVTVESANGSVRRYAFADSPISVGRSPFAELQLPEAFVSRWEGTLRFDDREITYFSLGATNPAFIDGREVMGGEDIQLSSQATLTIGELRLRFSREHVPEADLRRRGKKKPTLSDPDTSLKTAYLEVPQSAEGAPSHRPVAVPSSAAPAARERVESSVPERSSTAPAQHGDVRVLGRASVIGMAVPGEQDVRQYASRPSVPAGPPTTPGAALAQSVELRPSHTPGAGRPIPGEHAHPLPIFHASYRDAWRTLFEQLALELERASGPQRATLADQLQRAYPHITREPEFRELLKRLGLPARRPEVLEVRDWVADIARDVLPAKLQLDTGLTLDRILGLLETLTQSLAEINDAQDTVRQRWLGRSPRQNVLHSENGRAILAYLLNPKANWDERLLELEQTIREVVTHELALFKATMEGAKLLVDSLSPAAIADAEGVESESGGSGLWGRRRAKESTDARLWRRFVSMHEALTDGNRYQRVFLGRVFARTYLAAMGKSEGAPKR
ncbi:MAG: hypothetical protein RLZZ450_1272 [Pseudomonadota bacterium]|jgi:predicted component of type VI protein secretion system